MVYNLLGYAKHRCINQSLTLDQTYAKHRCNKSGLIYFFSELILVQIRDLSQAYGLDSDSKDNS